MWKRFKGKGAGTVSQKKKKNDGFFQPMFGLNMDKPNRSFKKILAYTFLAL